ncbi:hypothetical protein, no similarity [Maudiozyma saulgeensis]|uniref:Uncharacterized protein n=1 Tax=Maudiozyma saulgeensis TaxID=1789683 RepID=A0A1X7RA91_9SACH|nr:hypothetical protein, no similarity [Kazachstania saulgeensis]
MEIFIKNNNTLLKGTKFDSKPLFTAMKDDRFTTIANNFMTKYGKSKTKGIPIKGKEYIIHEDEDGGNPFVKELRVSLQPFYMPLVDSILLIVGCDDTDSIVITSPTKGNPGRFFTTSEYSYKYYNTEEFLRQLGKNLKFASPKYDGNFMTLEKDWHKSLRSRYCSKLKTYVVPNPVEYFPILFIGCSRHNIKHMYANVTSLLRASNEPRLYTPFAFIHALIRPLVFNIVGGKLLHRQRLPNIDIPNEEYFHFREEFLSKINRNMISDCKCRSNTELIPVDPPNQEYSWLWADIHLNRYEQRRYTGTFWMTNYNYERRRSPQRYSQVNCECSCQKLSVTYCETLSKNIVKN